MININYLRYNQKDSINISRTTANLGLGIKKNLIQETTQCLNNIPINFVWFIDSLSLRDFLLLDKDAILDKLIRTHHELEVLKMGGLKELATKFIKADF